MKIVPVRDRICHSCGSRACPALDAGNPGFLNTGSLFSQGQAWIPVFTGMKEKVNPQRASFQRTKLLLLLFMD